MIADSYRNRDFSMMNLMAIRHKVHNRGTKIYCLFRKVNKVCYGQNSVYVNDHVSEKINVIAVQRRAREQKRKMLVIQVLPLCCLSWIASL